MDGLQLITKNIQSWYLLFIDVLYDYARENTRIRRMHGARKELIIAYRIISLNINVLVKLKIFDIL